MAGSKVAQAVTSRYDWLTLAHAAAVAEFEDDPEAVKLLVKAARDGGFEHLAQRLRDERAEAGEIAKVADALTAAGVAVIERPSWRDSAQDLDRLVDSSGAELGAEEHSTCPGHGAYVFHQWRDDDEDTGEDDGDAEYVAVYVCTDPAAYGHRGKWERPSTPPATVTDEERAAASDERRRVAANNKAWRSAEVVRREWLTGFLSRKTAPRGGVRWAAESIIRADYDIRHALDRAHWDSARLFGLGSVSELSRGTSDGRVQMVALGLVLAAYEVGTGVHSWRNESEATGRYLRYLAAQGYELSDVERLACGDETAPEGNDDAGEVRS